MCFEFHYWFPVHLEIINCIQMCCTTQSSIKIFCNAGSELTIHLTELVKVLCSGHNVPVFKSSLGVTVDIH
jgi:hypothetical protein